MRGYIYCNLGNYSVAICDLSIHSNYAIIILMELTGKLNTKFIIETDSEIMIEKFIEADFKKIYYFSRNESNPLDSPILSDTEEDLNNYF